MTSTYEQQVGTPRLNELILVPKELSTFPNQQLQNVTRGHIASFAHDVVPALLRTKLIPEIEQANVELGRVVDASVGEVTDDEISAMIARMNDTLSLFVREIDETAKVLCLTATWTSAMFVRYVSFSPCG